MADRIGKQGQVTMNSDGVPSKYSYWTAVAVVIANMVGTGVFTSLGFQLLEIQSGFAILILWLAGGAAAFSGAMSYAELGTALPRSGGEYNFLTRIYHPAAGFVSGWVSATIGFAAPVALAAITFSAYGLSIFAENPSEIWRKLLACFLVLLLAFIHAGRRSASGAFQQGLTLFKVMTIVLFCTLAIIVIDIPEPIQLSPSKGDKAVIFSGSFAVSLIYVSFAYTGWNAAAYLSGEIKDVQRTLPGVLALATVIVILLYMALNAVFLKAAPIETMAGEVEIGLIAARALFGDFTANAAGLVMASLLVSTVSAMTIAGPRVLQVIGEDFPAFRRLSVTNKDGIPATAIYAQSALAVLFIVTSSFESILIFAGFAVGLNSFFTVLGLYILRWREPDLPRPYSVVGYPFTPLIYLGLTGWALLHVLLDKPIEGGFAIGVIGAGALFYLVTCQRAEPHQVQRRSES